MDNGRILLVCLLSLAGCASIPANTAANKWIGRSVSEAVLSFGEPCEVKQEGGRQASVWRFERYVDEVVPTGNVLGRDAGGRPRLYATQGMRRVKFACDLTLVSESGKVVDARPKPVAGVGPAMAGGCDGHGI